MCPQYTDAPLAISFSALKLEVKTLGMKIRKIISQETCMCTKFQVDWTSTSSKTTLTKNLNLLSHYHFLCSVDHEIGVKTSNQALKLEISQHREHVCFKFQVDWTSTSSKNSLTKNFNMKRDRWKNKWTDEQTNEGMNRCTRLNHIVHLSGA